MLINITSFDLHFVILLGAFNAKLKLWSVNDTTTKEGTISEILTSLHGMKQLIFDPTHIYNLPQAALTLFLSTSQT